jgi:hypothetical protein
MKILLRGKRTDLAAAQAALVSFSALMAAEVLMYGACA